ncbi:hypothetical protein [Nocardia abscessus]|nr:hypothetical protein [Nocardia abscessus]
MKKNLKPAGLQGLNYSGTAGTWSRVNQSVACLEIIAARDF